MPELNPHLTLLLLGCLYTLAFGGLAFLRREVPSVQFAVECCVTTILLAGGSWLAAYPMNPIFFLIILYIVTARSRLAVELANVLARRKQYERAGQLYDLALSLRPDGATRLIVLANRGAAEVHKGDYVAAIETLRGVLDAGSRPGLGLKYEAACQYNLGYAYEKSGNDARAVVHYNEAMDALPGSVYAQGAAAALKRRKAKREGD